MKQRIVVAKPPVYDECVAKFGKDVIVGKGILWSYGEVIYNPLNVDVPRELMAHEAVHGVRQLGQECAWWDRYLADPAFRFEEERLAHRAEWLNWVKWQPTKGSQLDLIAARLASPLYGSMAALDEARDGILRR